MTQLDAEHLAPKNIPRIRFRGKMDSVHGLTQLTAARARSFQLPELARHLDALAAYCREIVSAEYNHREVMAIQVAGLDAAALRHATHHPKETLGIPHLTPTPEDHEMLHWLNFLRTQVRETELAALDAFAPPPDYVPTRLDLIQAMNRLSSAVYYLELLFKAGKLSWQAQP
jgi:ethanolamine utilization cobalamin adenosyltransferase